jgi:adenylate cyclase
MRAKGCTDYVLLRLWSDGGPNNAVSFCSGAEGGFRDAELALLESLLPALALRVDLEVARFATRALLRTYLGRNASERVLAGAFRRGSGERLDAVIWLSDLRGFTERVDQSPLPLVLDALNSYFTCVADTIVAHGGEVLKFIGDAVLAVFPLADDPKGACRAALDAAERAFAQLEAANEERAANGLDALRIGVVLHCGEVMYGNIGATDRLDFTVIGSASTGKRLSRSASSASRKPPSAPEQNDTTLFGPPSRWPWRGCWWASASPRPTGWWRASPPRIWASR